jgi:light-regulated signal transduction histidine kinase (bacteriophytochrome)
MAGKRTSFDSECQCGSENQTRWLRLTLAPVPGPERASDDVILMHIDITDRKRAEEVLLQQAAELTRVNAELQQFAYVASHDLREPLRTVKSFSQLFVRRYIHQLGQDADQYLSYISDGVTRMEELIHDLLSYSRVAHGEQTDRESVDLSAVLERVMRSLNAVIEETGARVTASEMPVVNGNRTQLTQLLQNLIGNAIKYRREMPPLIHVSAESVEGGWRISVADNGAGIPLQYQELVFGLFKRLHSRKVPGTGIGLALCRKIAEQHGGSISIESEVGKGSTFHVFIADARGAQAGA